jgi:hypothetical protein
MRWVEPRNNDAVQAEFDQSAKEPLCSHSGRNGKEHVLIEVDEEAGEPEAFFFAWIFVESVCFMLQIGGMFRDDRGYFRSVASQNFRKSVVGG